ncbi:MAG: undecaprenyl-diphosphate phosphatase [Myxococcota bacterium]
MPPEIALALGALQGLTEFLPVSSSGHLAVGAMLFGEPGLSLATIVFLHGATLLATLVLFGRDVTGLTASTVRGLRAPRTLLESAEGRTVAGLVVATLPTALLGLLLEERVEHLARERWVIGLCFLASAGAALATRLARGDRTHLSMVGYLLVGVAQGLAVLPGVSRSGSTIAASMLLGMAPAEAFRFSFLLSLPAIGGALVLELGGGGSLTSVGASAWIGGAAALVVGYAALVLLRRVVVGGRFWAFALYLIPLGTAVLLWDWTT